MNARAISGLALLFSCSVPHVSWAQLKPSSTVAASNSDIQTAILFGLTDTEDAVRRGNNALWLSYRRLTEAVIAKQRAIRAAAKSSKELKRLQGELSALRREQERLLVELGKADQKYEIQIRAFREGLNGLLKDPDPRFLAALQRYADGDISAVDDLQEIARLVRTSRQAGVDAKNGDEQRTIARIVTDQKDRGNKTFKQAVAAWEEAAQVDPQNFEGWQQIAMLKFGASDYAGAELAAKRALAVSQTPVETSAASGMIGASLRAQGSLKQAREYLQRAVESERKILAQDPSNNYLLHDLAAALNNFADVEMFLQNLDSAEGSYREALAIRKRVSVALPTLQVVYRDYAVSLARVGQVMSQGRGRQDEARPFLTEALRIFRDLLRMNPDSSDAMFDVLLALKSSAIMEFQSQRFDEAKSLATEYLGVAQKLRLRDASNPRFSSEVRKAMSMLGIIAARQQDPAEAKKWFAAQLENARQELRTNPGVFRTQIDQVDALFHLFGLAKSLGNLGDMESAASAAKVILSALAVNASLSGAERDQIEDYLRMFS